MNSIRHYLLNFIMLALLGGSVAITGITYLNAKDETDELFDMHLRQIAFTLEKQQKAVHLLEKEHKEEGSADFSNEHKKVRGEEEFLIQLWNNKGHLAYSSHPAIKFPQLKREGLLNYNFKETAWRVYSIHAQDGVIQVSQPLNARVAMVREIAQKFIIPLLVQLPLLGLLIWLAVSRSLRPLQSLSEAIQKRSSTSLEPLSQLDIPIEVKPLVSELNSLLQRLGKSIHLQRQFTADAAHELRTPLTAIQLQLEILERAKSDDDRKDALSKLSAGIHRSIHLAQQMLLLARLEPEAAIREFTTVNLVEIARCAVEQFALQASEKEINLSFSAQKPAIISGDAEDLKVMINNLIDNAIHYTPDNGKVEVSIKSERNSSIIEITDNGIGIPPEERSRIFDRFYRVSGTGTIGTGLGLAIVKNIADRHLAKIVISEGSDSKGTSFQIIFPKKKQASDL